MHVQNLINILSNSLACTGLSSIINFSNISFGSEGIWCMICPEVGTVITLTHSLEFDL